MLELLIVMAALSAMAAVSVPVVHRTLRTYRLAGDARGISQTLTLAKMRAASNFTLEAVDWNSGSQSFSVKFFHKDLTQGGYYGQFEADASVPDVNVSNSTTLGTPVSGPDPSNVGTENTSRIVFNSRGLPVVVDTTSSPATVNPLAAPQAFYFNNGTDYYAVSIWVTGRIQIKRYNGSTWVDQ